MTVPASPGSAPPGSASPNSTAPSAASPGTESPTPELASLRACFAGRLLTDAAETEPFLVDYRRRWRGEALAVVQPDSTEDVAAVVRWCASHQVAVVPQGGNTGLTGGSVPGRGGRAVLLSLARLNRVRAIDPLNNTMTVEAGCILQRVQEAASDANRLFPLSLAAEGACTIGGNLATNAGGVQVIRYGNMRELCLGVEVVTPRGEIWNGLRGLRKDNTGYDLRDLFIGAEGTLGVITAAVLKLYPKPVGKVACFIGVETPHQALTLLDKAQARLAASLTAFELISADALSLVIRHMPGSRLPLESPCPWYVLLEVSDLESEARALEGAEAVLGEALEAGLVLDVAMSTSLAQFKAFWALRENISEAQSAEGKNIKHDISVPISRIGDFIDSTGQAIAAAFPATRMIVFGHLGDGNLHYNVSPVAGHADPLDEAFLANEGAINRLTHDAVAAHGGSISAEHGLGVLRRDEVVRYKQPVELAMMHAIKRALDPDGLMNPGKLLPAEGAGG